MLANINSIVDRGEGLSDLVDKSADISPSPPPPSLQVETADVSCF